MKDSELDPTLADSRSLYYIIPLKAEIPSSPCIQRDNINEMCLMVSLLSHELGN